MYVQYDVNRALFSDVTVGPSLHTFPENNTLRQKWLDYV